MRTLVVLAADHYLRQLVSSGAFDDIAGDETFWVTSARMTSTTGVGDRPTYLGAVEEPPARIRDYARLRTLMLAHLRGRSYTLRHKVSLLPWHQRWLYKTLALPPLFGLARRALLRRTGRNAQLDRIVEEVRPDVVIAPSGGIDPLVNDAIRSARRAGAPSLVVAHNWDNLSTKGAFPVQPDWLGVWGEQSVEHAERIHRMPRERVRPLGAPSLDGFFRAERGVTPSPFPFPYVLFAGCFAPFDELTALERLERAIEQAGLDLKVVYRPHPHRHPRRFPDRFRAERFRHVVLDPGVAEHYEESFGEYGPGSRRRTPTFPPLDEYPPRLEHAEFVVCPLSTMMVEAAIFDRRVLVVAYDDGIHPQSPASVVRYDHFQGVEHVPGFVLCRDGERLAEEFVGMARGDAAGGGSPRGVIGWWVHHDERPYAARLAALVEEVAGQATGAGSALVSSASS